MKAYVNQSRRSTQERDRLIADHIEVARRISMRMARKCPAWISSDDLVAAAMLGLSEAAERYDQSREEPFLAFAEKRIRGAVLDELRRGDIMPRRVRQLARKVGLAIQLLERRNAAPPSDEQVAAELGVTIEEYRDELEQLVHVTVGGLDELGDDMPRSDSSPERHVERRQILAQVRQALVRLDERDVLIFSLYYNEELTYHEIAQVLGVTVSRICQLHGRAIARLRIEMEDMPVEPPDGPEGTRG